MPGGGGQPDRHRQRLFRGLSEEIVGEALEGRRDEVLIATKARMPMGDGPNDAGLSRHYLIRECEASLSG